MGTKVDEEARFCVSETSSLSVIVPAYNAARFISYTLQSLANLDPSPAEVIVVNDGSTDGTSQKVAEFIALGLLPHVRLLEQEQRGVSAARNAGLAEATGDYVLFIDADDLVAPTLLCRLVSAVALPGPRPDIVCWRFDHVDQDSNSLGTFDQFFKQAVPALSSGAETLRRILLGGAQFIWTGSAAYRRGFLEDGKLRFTEGCATAEDSEFIWKCLSAASVVAWVDETLSYYVRRPGSVTATVHVNRFDGVRAHQRAAAFIAEQAEGRLLDVADNIRTRVVPRFMLVVALMASNSIPLRKWLGELEARHPGLVADIADLIREDLRSGRPVPPSARLFALSPRLGYRYLGIRGRWGNVGAWARVRLRDFDLRPSTRAGRAVLYAYTRANLGDDMLIKVLADRYPRWLFYVQAPGDDSRGRYTRALSELPNVRVVRRIPWVDGLAKRLGLGFRVNQMRWEGVERKCSVVVRLGGSIFIESPGWQDKVALDRRRLGSGKPTFVLGCNFGPFRSEKFLEDYRRIFARVDDVCFRDISSWKLFRDLDSARIAPDIGLLTKLTKGPQGNQPELGISVIDLARRPESKDFVDGYERTIVAVVRGALALGWRVVLAGFCTFEGDDEAINRIVRRLGPDGMRVETYIYDGNLAAALERVGGCTHWLATRFHATVIGWLSGAVTVPLTYSQKTQDFLDLMDYQGIRLSVDSLLPDAQSAAAILDALSQPSPEAMAGLDQEVFLSRAAEAAEQFRELDVTMNLF